MKERCKNCSVYETKTCRCWNCGGDCRNGIAPTSGDDPQCKNGNISKTRKNMFGKLICDTTCLTDVEIRRLVRFANKELIKRQMRARINNKKNIENKHHGTGQG